jgi:tetratricopeptide (TPR) repeat protein
MPPEPTPHEAAEQLAAMGPVAESDLERLLNRSKLRMQAGDLAGSFGDVQLVLAGATTAAHQREVNRAHNRLVQLSLKLLKATKDDPNNIELHLLRAHVCTAAREWAYAVEAFDKALELGAVRSYDTLLHQGMARYLLGVQLKNKGTLEEALKNLHDAMAACPPGDAEKRAQTLSQRSRVFHHLDRHADAWTDVSLALTLTADATLRERLRGQGRRSLEILLEDAQAEVRRIQDEITRLINPPSHDQTQRIDDPT